MRSVGLIRSIILGCVVFIPALAVRANAQSAGGVRAAPYYVAPDGNDKNTGSLGSPFLTLAKAQSAMRASGTKTTCIRAGAYQLDGPLNLTSFDNGETWQYYPPDGVDSAVLEGGNKLLRVIDIEGGSNITINGLKLEHFVDYGIFGAGSANSGAGPVASGITVENCDVGFNTTTNWSSAGIGFLAATPRTAIKNNYVHDVGSMGISFNTYFSPADSIGGSVIANNVVLRAVQRMYDGGGIYVSMHGGYQAGPGGVVVANNFVRDQGSIGLAGPYGASVIGIYLDDNANNVTVTGNIVGPPAEGSITGKNDNDVTAILVHDGRDNHISGNIVDLGDSGMVSTVVWGYDPASIAGMAGNTFTGNIVISSFTGVQRTSSSGITGYSYVENAQPASDFTIHGNLYFNYAGGQVRTDGPITSDGSPTVENPQVSGWTYTIAGGSPVFGAPVNFPPIAGNWGPPGYVIPRTGTAPSCPK